MVRHLLQRLQRVSTNNEIQLYRKMSSGSRINFAKDDAAGQGIATRLSAEIASLDMASRNASDAQSMIDTADGAYQEVHSMLLKECVRLLFKLQINNI